MQPYSSQTSLVKSHAGLDSKRGEKQTCYLKKSKSIVSSSEMLPGRFAGVPKTSSGLTTSSSEDKPMFQVVKIQEGAVQEQSAAATEEVKEPLSVAETFRQRLADSLREKKKTMLFADHLELRDP